MWIAIELELYWDRLYISTSGLQWNWNCIGIDYKYTSGLNVIYIQFGFSLLYSSATSAFIHKAVKSISGI